MNGLVEIVLGGTKVWHIYSKQCFENPKRGDHFYVEALAFGEGVLSVIERNFEFWPKRMPRSLTLPETSVCYKPEVSGFRPEGGER